MDIVNKLTYYSKVMSAYVVNTESTDDLAGDFKRVQVFIPEVQPDLLGKYSKFMTQTGSKKELDGFKKYPWAFNTVSGLVNGDLVYVTQINNTNGQYVIIGKDMISGGGGIGGGGELNAANLAELVIPILIHEECGYGKPPLYNDVWDKNIAGPCAVYTTQTSANWSVGLLNWDAARAYNLMYEIAVLDNNWQSYFTDKTHDFVKNLAYDVSMGTSRGGTHSVMITGRTAEKSIIDGIKKLASSSAGQEVQRKKARADVTEYVQDLMDEGITNPAILIYMADFCNQWGSGQPSSQPYLGKMHDAAKNPSTIMGNKKVSDGVGKAMSGYENPNQMMKEVEALHIYWVDVVSDEAGVLDYAPRRNRVIAYIRELYKQGKLSQFAAGMSMLGNLNQATFNGLTLAYPFEDTINEEFNFSGNAYNGSNKFTMTCKMRSPKTHYITSLFGARWLVDRVSKHTGVDFTGDLGDVLYASHSGTLEIKDSKNDTLHSGGYGYYATISFKNGEDNWVIYYGHMDRGSAKNYGYEVGKEYTINAGQPIGHLDSTGSSTGDHLHFELRRNGKYVNPLPYMGLGNEHYPILSSMSNFLEQ